MDYPEKIVEIYLKLNGFFTINHFSTLTQGFDNIDILALRIKNSQETAALKSAKNWPLALDDEFFKGLGMDPKKSTIGIIVQVDHKKDESVIDDNLFKGMVHFFG
jgi:hypothetical protein